ncbi:hypothetical protein, partial [Faecalibacterium hattorii]|uniref:hypothetical protein n=1 Tax=Faecalibacterium hattorii TaxID=2935520 RepID=UPI003AAAE032
GFRRRVEEQFRKVESTSNLYKIQFDSESGAETTNTLSVDNHDFGMTSVYVVGADDTELTVTAKDKIFDFGQQQGQHHRKFEQHHL